MISGLPAAAARSLTWDQGRRWPGTSRSRCQRHAVYFCDPHSPWQRGTNENTNGLLRQYFPKSTDLSRARTRSTFGRVAHQLDRPPRKTLGWKPRPRAHVIYCLTN